MALNHQTDFTVSSLLKIAIISDTHEVLDGQINDAIKTCDIAIHAGDIGANSVLEEMQPKSGHVIAVAGNNDKPYLWDFKEWNIVKNLPQSIELSVPGGIIAVEHGHEHGLHKPSHDDLRVAHAQARLVIYGHTHIQVIDKDDPDKHVLNPGAAGHTRNKGGPSCIILTIDDDNWDYEILKFSEQCLQS
ncbi:MAG: metallophosphoesterase family protein [Gammaproteobacteria bacterium]|nr:metallophosphoesterase family protein [Gammaproteobacteria bacterium]